MMTVLANANFAAKKLRRELIGIGTNTKFTMWPYSDARNAKFSSSQKKGYEGHIANKHAPKIIGTDGKPKTKKDVEGLNKVLKEIQSKKELEMVQRIIAQVKAECEATGGDTQRRGYTKH